MLGEDVWGGRGKWKASKQTESWENYGNILKCEKSCFGDIIIIIKLDLGKFF